MVTAALPQFPAGALPGLARQFRELVFPQIGLNLDSETFRAAVLTPHTEMIINGGVRGGKSKAGAAVVFGDVLAKQLAGTYRKLLYWVVGPDYKQPHSVMEYLLEFFTAGRAGQRLVWNHANEGPWQLTWSLPVGPGLPMMEITIETKSTDRMETLASVAPDGILVDEAGQCREEVRDRCIERASEKGAWIVYSGTLENDELKPTYVWYSDLAAQWKEDPSPHHATYSLPSWDNLAIYGACTTQIAANPALASYCPDEDHGEAHRGEYGHPVFAHARATMPASTYQRRFGGIPVGLEHKVYSIMDRKDFLQDMPDNLKWVDAVGGEDYGGDHPSALVVITITADPSDSLAPKDMPKGIAWVREVWFNDGSENGDPGDTFLLQSHKTHLTRKYSVYRWGIDPNERFAAKNDPGTEAVSISDGSRNYRINLTKSRLTWDKLYFDQRGPGVAALYAEMSRVHKARTRAGELKLVRLHDDRTAALEDAIEVLDGKVFRPLPNPSKITYAGKQFRRRPVPVLRRI